jgi:hypothetical protein
VPFVFRIQFEATHKSAGLLERSISTAPEGTSLHTGATFSFQETFYFWSAIGPTSAVATRPSVNVGALVRDLMIIRMIGASICAG